MGRLETQENLFYRFRIEDHVPQDHLLRRIDWLRKKVEMLFAHLKRHLGFKRLRLRGLKGANEEFLLAATAQNLKRLAKMVPC